MPMTVTIHDVGHGACATIVTPNEKLVMIDTGHSDSRPWWPSVVFAGRTIEELIISNFDNDHLSDFEEVQNACRVNYYRHNWTLNREAVVSMKGGTHNVTQNVDTALRLVGSLSSAGQTTADELGGITFRPFYNNYPTDFSNSTNNLSYVSFFSYGDHKIIFPGDLERDGWAKLLELPDFRAELADVTIFVASHHGRKNGCLAAVFDHCTPRIAVMSDRDKNFETQETVPWYSQRVSGVTWSGSRHDVFTTRKFGDITFTIKEDGWAIDTEKGV